MALTLVFCDGFDTYDTLNLEWTVIAGNVTMDITGTLSRSGLGCCQIVSGGGGPQKNFGLQNRILLTGAVNTNGYPAFGSFGDLFVLTDSTNNSWNVRVCYNSDGSVSVRRGSDPSSVELGRSAPNVFRLNTYNYLACRTFIATHAVSNGSVTIWLNGVVVLDLENVYNNDNDPVAKVDTFQLKVVGGITQGLWDDVTLWLWTDPVADVFPYTPSVYPALPVSDSAPLQWSPKTGITHFPMVNSVPENDANYVSDATPGQIDQYIHAIPLNQQKPAVGNAPTILGIQHSLLAAIDVAGARSIGSSENGAAAPTSFALSTSFLFYDQPYTPGLASFAALSTTPFGPIVTA